MSYGEIVNRILEFRDTLTRAITYDAWGQVLEAEKEYMRLVKSIQESFSNTKLPFAEHQMKFLNKVASACQMRARDAQELTGEREIALSQMELLVPMMENLPAETPPFPIGEVQGLIRDLHSLIAKRKAPQTSTNKEDAGIMSPASNDNVHDDEPGDDDDDDYEAGAGGSATSGASSAGRVQGSVAASTLLPRKHFPSHTGITLRVEKIVLKDPDQYIEPFVTVRLCDPQGKAVRLGEPQDTAPGRCVGDAVVFDQDVHLQLPYEQIKEWDYAVFIEFMYYKPKSKKKDKMKCLCWCMLESDEMAVNETLPLEIYAKKPVYNIRHTGNYAKLKLHGSQGHFLYVTVIRQEPDSA